MKCANIFIYHFIAIATVAALSTVSAPLPADERDAVRPEGMYPDQEDDGAHLIALTFDDGLMRDATPRILDALKKRNLHATFFVSGHTIRRTTWQLLHRMVDEGHEIANHSWTHDQHMALRERSAVDHEKFLISEVALTQVRVDIALLSQNTEEFVELDRMVFRGFPEFPSRARQVAEAEGIYQRHAELMAQRGYPGGSHVRTLRWFRPPGGSPYLRDGWSAEQRHTFTQAMNKAEVQIALWDQSSRDSIPGQKADAEKAARRVAAAATKIVAEGGILLAHDRLSGRPLGVLLDIIATCKDRLVTLDVLYSHRTAVLPFF